MQPLGLRPAADGWAFAFAGMDGLFAPGSVLAVWAIMPRDGDGMAAVPLNIVTNPKGA